jgi:hypothetical protein
MQVWQPSAAKPCYRRGIQRGLGDGTSPILSGEARKSSRSDTLSALSVDSESTESAGTAHLTSWKNNLFQKNSTVKATVSKKLNLIFQFLSVFIVYFI